MLSRQYSAGRKIIEVVISAVPHPTLTPVALKAFPIAAFAINFFLSVDCIMYFGCIFIFCNCISYVVVNCFVFCILYLKAFPSAAFAINFFPRVSQQSHRVSQHILFCQIISPRHVQLCTASLTMGVKAMLPQVNWCLCSGDVQCLHMIINNDNI